MDPGRPLMDVTSTYDVRQMTVEDIPQVMKIERTSFPATWPQTAYQRELTRNNLALYFVVVGGHAARPGEGATPARPLLRRVLRSASTEREPAEKDDILGFAGLWRMVDEGHIVTIAVREDRRRLGLGGLLLSRAFMVADQENLPALTLEVRVSNQAAQALYEKWGFQRLGLRKRYYSDNNEDAVIMTTPDLADSDLRRLIAEQRAELRQRGFAA
ncbi:MAG: ribosomal-protein-alanine N-acetyltransferase [Dehalococcoidia bacterium]|nr:ribosomal-protein-alanine N-acetyltransferase [Dehalococcoidia bacterium]